MIKENTKIAQAYIAHVLDVVNHFKWRYKLQQQYKATITVASGWHDLSETDQWMNYYYDANGDLQKEQLLFWL